MALLPVLAACSPTGSGTETTGTVDGSTIMIGTILQLKDQFQTYADAYKKGGYVPVQVTDGAGGIAAQLCRGEDDWVCGDFAIGDVLMFPAFTVHRSLPVRRTDRARLSMDVRFQPASDPIEAGSLTNHAGREWEEIDAKWPTEDQRYYWRASSPRLSLHDESLQQPGVRIC